jgi:hypothetical protein
MGWNIPKWVMLLVAFALCAVGLALPVDLDQDINEYIDNANSAVESGSLGNATLKLTWYAGIFIPLVKLTGGDAAAAVNVLKAMLFSALVLASARYSRDFRVLVCFVVMFVVVPAFSENYLEYLRQATAMVFMLQAVTVKRRVYALFLGAVSVVLHWALILIAAALFFSWLWNYLSVRRDNRDPPSIFPVFLGGLTASIIFLIVVIAVPSGEVSTAFLFGDSVRSSIGGFSYCMLFFAVTGVVRFMERKRSVSSDYLLTLSGLLVVGYPFFIDFGRMFSLILPFYAQSAFCGCRPNVFGALRILACVVFGSAYKILG